MLLNVELAPLQASQIISAENKDENYLELFLCLEQRLQSISSRLRQNKIFMAPGRDRFIGCLSWRVKEEH